MQDENSESSHGVQFDNALRDHYVALGRMTSSWALLEFSIDHLIWYLTETPDSVGACVTTQIMGSAGKMRALIALAHLRGGGENLIRELNRFEAQLRPLGELRNRYTHDWWGWQSETGAVVQFALAVDQKKLRFGLEERGVGEMNDLISRIETTQMSLNAISERVRRELSPLQDEWSEREFGIHLG